MGIAEVTAGFMAHKVILTVGELKGEDIDNYLMITAKGGTCVATAIGSCSTPKDAQPGHADADAEEPAGHHLRRRQPALRHSTTAVDVQGGQAQHRRQSPGSTSSSRSTRATRTCWTARTFAASSATRTTIGSGGPRVHPPVAAGSDRLDDGAQPAGDVCDGDHVRHGLPSDAPRDSPPAPRAADHVGATGRPPPPGDSGGLHLGTDAAVDAHRALVEAVHEHGAKIQPQIVHAGPDGWDRRCTA